MTREDNRQKCMFILLWDVFYFEVPKACPVTFSYCLNSVFYITPSTLLINTPLSYCDFFYFLHGDMQLLYLILCKVHWLMRLNKLNYDRICLSALFDLFTWWQRLGKLTASLTRWGGLGCFVSESSSHAHVQKWVSQLASIITVHSLLSIPHLCSSDKPWRNGNAEFASH